MENATKALLMAGAILIAIILIALGLKIVNSNKGVTEQVDKLSTSMEVSMFNSQFEPYTRELQSASETKTLINKIMTNNYNNPDRFIVLTYCANTNIVIDNEDENYSKPNEVQAFKDIFSSLKTNMDKKFRITSTVSIDSVNYGRITQILVEMV